MVLRQLRVTYCQPGSRLSHSSCWCQPDRPMELSLQVLATGAECAETVLRRLMLASWHANLRHHAPLQSHHRAAAAMCCSSKAVRVHYNCCTVHRWTAWWSSIATITAAGHTKPPSLCRGLHVCTAGSCVLVVPMLSKPDLGWLSRHKPVHSLQVGSMFSTHVGFGCYQGRLRAPSL